MPQFVSASPGVSRSAGILSVVPWLSAGDGVGVERRIGYGPFAGMLGADSAATAPDDDYEFRRARTPVPEFVAEAVEIHLEQGLRPRGQPLGAKASWWNGGKTSTAGERRSMTGCGTRWRRCCSYSAAWTFVSIIPRVPPGERVQTRADELRLGLDKCIASYILPQNMVWWQLDPAGRYTQCLVREYEDPSERIDADKDGAIINVESRQHAGLLAEELHPVSILDFD